MEIHAVNQSIQDIYTQYPGMIAGLEGEPQRSGQKNGTQRSGRTQEATRDGRDRVEISGAARARAGEKSVESNGEVDDASGLSDEEQQLVEDLRAADREVRAHERAHMAAAGSIMVRGANFAYETGPDGVRYAVGGDVTIDVSREKDPKDTIAKAQQIRRAALAPVDPSPQDQRVAAEAVSMESEARQEVAREQAEEQTEGSNAASDSAGNRGNAGSLAGSGGLQGGAEGNQENSGGLLAGIQTPAGLVGRQYSAMSGVLGNQLLNNFLA